MRVLYVASLIMLAGFLTSCGSDEDAVKDAEEEVFAIHDEVMPNINVIIKLKNQLNQRLSAIDSLKATGSAAATLRMDEEREQVQQLRQDLVVADSLMMSWMNSYNGDTLAKLSSEDAMRYLAEQKEQINDVKRKVNSSIEQTRAFLQEP